MAELTRMLASWTFTSLIGLSLGGALLLLFTILRPRYSREGLAFELGYWARQVDLRSRRAWIMTLLAVMITALLAAGLGAPKVTARERVSIYGKPVMTVVDVSGSMDYRARLRSTTPGGPVQREERSNIEKARAIFQDVLSRDLGVHYGLLLYSTEHYIARHFAFKRALLRDTLENDEEITFISTGTRTADALGTARRYLTEHAASGDKAILLISDMQGDLEAMVAMAEEMENCQCAGIKLYAIVIGLDSERAIGRRTPPPQVDGVMMVEMNDQPGIEALCRELVAMRDSPVNSEETPVRKNVTPFLAAASLGLAMLCVGLSEGCWRRIP